MPVAISLVDLQDFRTIFSGNKEAYGIHIYSETEQGKKEEGKNFTKIQPITDQQYKEHLDGQKGLGVIPINGNNTCSFAVIDIDIYDKKILIKYLNFIYECDLPVIPFRSKSGGLHIYLFLSIPVAANLVKSHMLKIASLIGLSKDVEIFPKQSTLIAGQVGNWINLPYYNTKKSKTYMYNKKGGRTNFIEALHLIKNKIQNEQSLLQYFENLPLADGPPCLQHIYMKRITDNRNEYLFSLTCYYKTKYGEDFESKIVEANTYLKDPIPLNELQRTIITTHKKKDYTYKCGAEPLISFCNKMLCKSRQYGMGGDEISELNFGELTQYSSDPPYYEWSVNDVTLRFYDEMELMQQQRFRALCLRKLYVYPMKLKELNWTKIINNALKNINIKQINAEEDISPGSQFKEYLIEFLEKRALAESKQQILVDRVYKDQSLKAYVFKTNNLLSFLIAQKQFRYFGVTEIQVRLRDLGGLPKRYYINEQSKATRVWVLPFEALKHFVEEERIDKTEITFEEEYKDDPF